MDPKRLPLYDQALFCDAFIERGPLMLYDDVVPLMKELAEAYRQRGAHPFFVQQAVLVSTDSFSQTLRSQVMEAVNRDLQRSFARRQQVPGSPTGGLLPRLSSRLYGTESPRELDPGILSGAIVELEAELIIMATAGGSGRQRAHAAWNESQSEVFDIALGHPAAGVTALATLLRAAICLNALGITNETVDIEEKLRVPEQRVRIFLREKLYQQGLLGVLWEILETWSDIHPITWDILFFLFHELDSRGTPWASQALQALLAIRETRGSLHRHAARQVLRLQPRSQGEHPWVFSSMQAVLSVFDGALRKELPDNPEMGEAVYSWMATVDLLTRASIIFLLLFQKGKPGQEDAGMQPFLQEVFGSGAWEPICRAWHKRNQEVQASGGEQLLLPMDRSAPEYQELWRVMGNIARPERSKPSVPSVPQGYMVLPRNTAQDRKGEWNDLLAQIEELLPEIPDQQRRPFQERLADLRGQKRKRPKVARRFLEEIQALTSPAKKEEVTPADPEPLQPQQEEVESRGVQEATPPRIPPSLVPAGVKQKDMRNRLRRAGWQRRSRGSSKHEIYVKEGRWIGISFGTKNTRTLDRFTLAAALSEAQFSPEEVQELFS